MGVLVIRAIFFGKLPERACFTVLVKVLKDRKGLWIGAKLGLPI